MKEAIYAKLLYPGFKTLLRITQIHCEHIFAVIVFGKLFKHHDG